MRLSLVVATHTYAEIRYLARALEQLHGREHLELVLVCPSLSELGVPPGWPPEGTTVLETGEPLPVHQARARGVQAASGDYVALLEDHGLPRPHWARAMLARMQEGWAAIGPEIICGNPRSLLAEGAFLLTYGEWCGPGEAGVVPYISGHNSCYRRDLLLQAPDLEVLMACPNRWQRCNGPLFFEPGAQVVHWDPSTWQACSQIFLAIGRVLGWARTRDKAWPWRALFALALPLVAAAHWWRGCRQYLRARSQFRLGALGYAFFWSLCWATGEALGSVLPQPGDLDRLSELEVNRWRFVHPADLPA